MAALLPETMRAAYVERLGLPEAIVVGELAVPLPGPTDVLVARQGPPRGRLILSAASGELPPLPVRDLYTRGVSLHGVVINRATVSELADVARLIDTMLATGGLRARIAEVRPLEATAEVHARLEAGMVTGRMLVRL